MEELRRGALQMRRQLRKPEAEQHLAEWNALAQAWPTLSIRAQNAILVLAGIIRVEKHPVTVRPRTPKGQTPNWLQEALTILQDTEGRVTDRALARRLDLASSTLSRCEQFRRARETFPRPTHRGGARVRKKAAAGPAGEAKDA